MLVHHGTDGYEVAVSAAAKVLAELRGGGLLNKDEVEKVSETFNTPEIRLLPPGNNAWRLSNALSLFANNVDEGGEKERAVELRHVAGRVLDKYEVEAEV